MVLTQGRKRATPNMGTPSGSTQWFTPNSGTPNSGTPTSGTPTSGTPRPAKRRKTSPVTSQRNASPGNARMNVSPGNARMNVSPGNARMNVSPGNATMRGMSVRKRTRNAASVGGGNAPGTKIPKTVGGQSPVKPNERLFGGSVRRSTRTQTAKRPKTVKIVTPRTEMRQISSNANFARAVRNFMTNNGANTTKLGELRQEAANRRGLENLVKNINAKLKPPRLTKAQRNAVARRRAAPKTTPKSAPKTTPKSAPKTAPKSAPKTAPKSAPKSAPKTPVRANTPINFTKTPTVKAIYKYILQSNFTNKKKGSYIEPFGKMLIELGEKYNDRSFYILYAIITNTPGGRGALIPAATLDDVFINKLGSDNNKIALWIATVVRMFLNSCIAINQGNTITPTYDISAPIDYSDFIVKLWLDSCHDFKASLTGPAGTKRAALNKYSLNNFVNLINFGNFKVDSETAWFKYLETKGIVNRKDGTLDDYILINLDFEKVIKTANKVLIPSMKYDELVQLAGINLNKNVVVSNYIPTVPGEPNYVVLDQESDFGVISKLNLRNLECVATLFDPGKYLKTTSGIKADAAVFSERSLKIMEQSGNNPDMIESIIRDRDLKFNSRFLLNDFDITMNLPSNVNLQVEMKFKKPQSYGAESYLVRTRVNGTLTNYSTTAKKNVNWQNPSTVLGKLYGDLFQSLCFSDARAIPGNIYQGIGDLPHVISKLGLCKYGGMIKPNLIYDDSTSAQALVYTINDIEKTTPNLRGRNMSMRPGVQEKVGVNLKNLKKKLEAALNNKDTKSVLKGAIRLYLRRAKEATNEKVKTANLLNTYQLVFGRNNPEVSMLSEQMKRHSENLGNMPLFNRIMQGYGVNESLKPFMKNAVNKNKTLYKALEKYRVSSANANEANSRPANNKLNNIKAFFRGKTSLTQKDIRNLKLKLNLRN